MSRLVYLVCYDVKDSARRVRVLNKLKAFSIGGQKSCHECLMTHIEKDQLLKDIFLIINHKEDRVHVFHLDPRTKRILMGQAKPISTKVFLIV